MSAKFDAARVEVVPAPFDSKRENNFTQYRVIVPTRILLDAESEESPQVG